MPAGVLLTLEIMCLQSWTGKPFCNCYTTCAFLTSAIAAFSGQAEAEFSQKCSRVLRCGRALAAISGQRPGRFASAESHFDFDERRAGAVFLWARLGEVTARSLSHLLIPNYM